MKKDKGFTLVELIVAITVGSLASLLVVMVLNLAFTQYRISRTESQLEIEAQEMSEKLKPLLMCCDKVEKVAPTLNDETMEVTQNGYIMIHSTDPNTGEMFYYYLIIKNRKCYLFKCNTEVDVNTLVCSDINYLAQYIEDIHLDPMSYDFTEDTKNRVIECRVDLVSDDKEYSTSFFVNVRAY